jgi:hypothetical protein
MPLFDCHPAQASLLVADAVVISPGGDYCIVGLRGY